MRCLNPWALGGLLAAAMAPTQAQTHATATVSVYGSVDAGFTYIDNAGGGSLKRLDSGALYANRLGFRGTEDLGGGLAAVFVLESGFNVDDGTLAQGGLGFGRQSYVGLRSPWGTFTAGRQYDLLYAGSPLPLDVGALLLGGLAGATGGAGTAVDNHSGGVRFNNSLKWQGRFGPWTAATMYGVGNEDGEQRMRSFAVAYQKDGLWVGLGHARDNYSAPTAGNKVTIASLNWNASPADKLILTLSDARAASRTDATSRSRMYQLGWLHQVTPLWMVGLAYGRADIRNASAAPGDLRQWGLGTQYALSKRSTLYSMVSRVRSSGSAGTAYSGVPGVGSPAATLRSSDDTQIVVKGGFLHRF